MFWRDRKLRENLPEAQRENAEHLFNISLYTEGDVPLSDFLGKNVVAWVRGSSAMANQIEASITTDRNNQLVRIKDEKAIEQLKLNGLKGTKREKEGIIKVKEGEIAAKKN